MRVRISSLIASLMLSGQLLAADIVALNINSAYRIQGDRAIAPVQVFDDGARTYLQLRDPRYPPAVLLEDGRVVPFTNQQPYLVLTGVYDVMVLRYGRHLATIRSRAALSRPRPSDVPVGQNVWYGVAEPSKLDSKASEPIPAVSLLKEPVARVVSSEPVIRPASNEPAIQPTQEKVDKNVFKGSFTVDRAVSGASGAPQSNPPVSITVLFSGKNTKVSIRDVIRLSDLMERAGQKAKFVIRSLGGPLDKKRRDEIKRQLLRLGVDVGCVRFESGYSNPGEIVVSGEKA